jgi:hypothetical protein
VNFRSPTLPQIHSSTPEQDGITDEHKRAAILICSRNGRTAKQIIEFTGLPKSTVYQTIKRNTIRDQPKSGRPATATTPKNINKVGILPIRPRIIRILRFAASSEGRSSGPIGRWRRRSGSPRTA